LGGVKRWTRSSRVKIGQARENSRNRKNEGNAIPAYPASEVFMHMDKVTNRIGAVDTGDITGLIIDPVKTIHIRWNRFTGTRFPGASITRFDLTDVRTTIGVISTTVVTFLTRIHRTIATCRRNKTG
jgi:hypothetical protein